MLIIVPTRELAAQVCKELGWLLHDVPGARVVAVTGGSPIYRDKKVLARHPRVLVGTPGRLLDHVRNGALDLGNVSELVLDEADQMLDLGFREELEGLLDTTPTTRRTHLVSATFPDGIQRLAARYQREPVAIEGTRLGDANEDIEHRGYLVHPRDRYAALVNLLLLAEGERTLVFVERRADALEVAERLETDGFAAMPLSGELAQSQRERTLAAFRAGRVKVLVATDVAARGLDVPDVATVIHTSPPIDAQVYTHRSGRTGRAGKQGASVLFAPPHRRRKVERLLGEAGLDLRWSPLPRADEVQRQLTERVRTRMKAELDAALEAGLPEAQLEKAAELLASRDARSVVAALLARLEPNQRAEPRDVESPQVREERPWKDRGARGGSYERGPRHDRDNGYGNDRGHGYDRGARNDRGPSYGGGRGQGAPYERGDRGGRYERGREAPQRQDYGRRDNAPRRGRFDGSSAVRFFVNWGENQGATPGRLLAALCRRGEVTGSHIGSIAIHPNASTFDVHVDVAEQFERLAGRRDPRDPQTLIRRDRGPRQSSPRPRR